jgi:hypothetical protein
MDETYCINGCGKLAVGESTIAIVMEGIDDFSEVVELCCDECLSNI